MKSNMPQRFYSLDVLRGFAALSIVLWHWQHFFSPLNVQGVSFSIEKQPGFNALYFFYIYGYAAVQLFFCLSGFIFFWLYSKRIFDKFIYLKSFSILRFSRLYPLHFATLIFVAIGQLAYSSITDTYFVYPFNDTYHMLLNLFFVSSWGFEKGFSFNAPIWSVSVEVLLYGTFFIFCRIFGKNVFALLSAVFLGYLISRFNSLIGIGLIYFFLGGLVYIIYEKLIKSSYFLKTSIWLPFFTLTVWITLLIVTKPTHDFAFSEMHWIIQKVIYNIQFALFPMTVISLALIETKKGTLGKIFSLVGDISYSSYLLHFPLQLTVALVVAILKIDSEVFYSSWFMALFFCALIFVSFASYRYFEIPMQRYLRRNISQKNSDVKK